MTHTSASMTRTTFSILARVARVSGSICSEDSSLILWSAIDAYDTTLSAIV